MIKKILQNRLLVIRSFAFFLTFFILLVVVLFSLYDTKSGSGIPKTQWYNATYAVRSIMVLAAMYTSVRIYTTAVLEKPTQRLGYAVHYSLYMLNICCVLYFDPVTTALLPEQSPSDFGHYCQQMSIAHMVMTIVFVVFYTASDTAGAKE